jgi:hypothetical protein
MQQLSAALRADKSHPEVLGGRVPHRHTARKLPNVEEQLRRQIERHGLTETDIEPIKRMLDGFEWGEKNLPGEATDWALVSRSDPWGEDYPRGVLKNHEHIGKTRTFVTDVTATLRLVRIRRTSSCLALLRQVQPYLLKMVPVQLGERRLGYSADEVRASVERQGTGHNEEFCLDSGTLSDIFATCPEVLPAQEIGVVACGDTIDRDTVPVYTSDDRGHLKVVLFAANHAHRSHGQATGYLFRHSRRHL